MDLDIITVTYLFLILAPFILVCFFSLTSIFNQDFKGLVYLVGLLFSCFVTVMIDTSKLLESIFPSKPTVVPSICNSITIGGIENWSSLPLGQTIFGYTYAYLLYAICAPNPNLVLQNIPTIVFFPILIIFDLWWKLSNECSDIFRIFTALIIGGFVGWTWGAIIGSSNSNLQYFAGINNTEICSAPSKQTFRCNVYKNGQMITSTTTGSPG